MTELELIERLREKDESAFKELVRLFGDRVFNTALGMLQHQHDAEDIAQEVFIKVHRSIVDFKHQAGLATWLYRITVNRCLDHLRSKKRRGRSGFITGLFNKNEQPLHEPEDFNHPGVQLDKKGDAAILFKLIEQLPENQRTAFVLNKVEGLTYEQIAAILNVSSSAVDSLLQRARQNIKKKIDEKYFRS